MKLLEHLNFYVGLGIGVILTALAAALKGYLEKWINILFEKLPLFFGKLVRYRRWEREYRRYVYEQHRYLRFPGIRQAVTLHRPQLEDAFVNLEIQTNTGTIYSEASSKTLGLGEVHTLDTALKRFTRLVILGAPGSGKTTILQHIVCALLAPTKRAKHQPLPIFAPLRRCPMNGATIVQHLTDSETGLLPAELIKSYPTGFFEDRLKRGRCLVCFDGLDEVFNENDHVKAAQFVQNTAAVYDKCTVVVSSRLAGWRNLLGSDFARFTIRELSQREIEGLVRRWYFSVVHQELLHNSPAGVIPSTLDSKATTIAVDHASRMLRVLESHRIGNIASTPLLLSLMCLLFYIRQDLPRRRVQLYSECIELLLESWDRLDKQLQFNGLPGLDHKIDLLAAIALHLFQCNASEIPVSELVEVVSTFIQERKLSNDPRTLISFIEQRSGLLVEKSVGVVGFTHLTFQEYLCALGLKDNPDGIKILIERLATSETEEMILLFAGIGERADMLVAALVEHFEQSGELRYIIAAGKAIPEAPRIPLQTKGEVSRVLSQLFDTSNDPSTLSLIQSTLAGLGIEKIIVKSFGDYEILAEIGRGGMATVYRGREKRTTEPVALKVYHSLSESPIKRAMRGLSDIKTLRHPNLVAVRDFGENENRLFVAMNFIDGRNLQTIVDEIRGTNAEAATQSQHKYAGNDTDPTVLRGVEYKKWVRGTMLQVTDAVRHLHTAGILHGDLKPSNIVWSNGRAILIDIGVDSLIANLSHHDPDRTIVTLSLFLVGTMDYMSPERKRGNPATPADDVFALIRILEVLCTLGLQPVDGFSVAHSLPALWEPSPDLRSLFDATYSRRGRKNALELDEFIAALQSYGL